MYVVPIWDTTLYSDDTINLETAAQMLAVPATVIARLQQGTFVKWTTLVTQWHTNQDQAAFQELKAIKELSSKSTDCNVIEEMENHTNTLRRGSR